MSQVKQKKFYTLSRVPLILLKFTARVCEKTLTLTVALHHLLMGSSSHNPFCVVVDNFLIAFPLYYGLNSQAKSMQNLRQVVFSVTP